MALLRAHAGCTIRLRSRNGYSKLLKIFCSLGTVPCRIATLVLSSGMPLVGKQFQQLIGTATQWHSNLLHGVMSGNPWSLFPVRPDHQPNARAYRIFST